MTNHQPLAVKDLVWGKVEPYPWWPGKIIQIISDENTLIYKVSFFGDSSYSFLKNQQLIQFSRFDFDLNSSFPQNLKLQKAVKQANKLAFDKKTNNKSTESQSTTPEISQKPVEQIAKEFADVKAKADADSNQPLFECQQTNHQIEINDIFSTEITTNNVFVLIQSLSSASQGNSYSYSERKQTISFKQKLKQALLAKYNLLTCPSQNSQKKIQNPHPLQKESLKRPRIDKRFKRENLLKNREQFQLHKNKIKCLFINKIKNTLAAHFGSEGAKEKSRLLYELIDQNSRDSTEKFIKMAIKSLRILDSNIAENGQDFLKGIIKNLEES